MSKNFLRKIKFRKRGVAGITALALTGVLAVGAFNATRAAFDVKAPYDGKATVGNFEITVTPFKTTTSDAISAAYASNSDSLVFDATAAEVLSDESDNTTASDGTAVFGTFDEFSTYPGKVNAYGYKVENSGNVPDMSLTFEMNSSFTKKDSFSKADGDAFDSSNANYGVDPRERIKYTVFSSEDGKQFTKVGTGNLDRLNGNNLVKVTDDDKTITLSSASGKTVYYIVVFDFTDASSEWAANDKGDNAFKGAQVGINLAIRAQQPGPVVTSSSGQDGI